MIDKLAQLWPEIALFVTTCAVMIIGQSRERATRRLCRPISLIGVVVALALAHQTSVATTAPLPYLAMYGKILVCIVGLVLILLMAGVADREIEADVDRGRPFDAARAIRGEFYALVLFSLTGLMLCAGSDDLIFLFLALELTSLPTYVMVSLSTQRNRSMEAGVKYFFLGAMSAAIFLFGFAFIYGGTGSTHFLDIAKSIDAQVKAGGVNTLTMMGLLIAIVGVLFKVAAVPMHFYTPDVYQGASASVSGFLAFVPKAAGFFAIMLLLSLVGWRFGPTGDRLPEALHALLWIVAILTMSVGNVLALVQTSVKRILAYSSIAHTGYMLVAVLVGPGAPSSDLSSSGLAAVWFYLLSYGITTAGAFAAVASLEKRAPDGQMDEADHVDDFRGLIHTYPLVGWTLVMSAVGLLGLPPLLGFFAKLPLFSSAIRAGEYTLVIVLAINSAIAAYYYLRLAYMGFIDKPESAPNAAKVVLTPFESRRYAGMASIIAIIGLMVLGTTLGEFASIAGRYVGSNVPIRQRAEVPASAEPATSPVVLNEAAVPSVN